MSGDTPPISTAVVPAVMLCIVGALLGLLIGLGAGLETKTDLFYFVAGGLFLGLAVALYPDNGIVFRLLMVYLPGRFYQQESVMVQESDEPPVILVEIEERGMTYRIPRCGICLNDWMLIAQTAQSGAYNQTLFEKVLGREEEIGRNKYREVSPMLEDIGILKTSGTSFKVTDYEGKEFFEKLAKGDWRVLDKLPPNVKDV